MAEMDSFIRPEVLWQSLGLRAEQSVVHLGCGAGFYIVAAAQIVGPKGKAVGVDIRPDMLDEVENRARRNNVESIVHTLRANIENTPGTTLSDGSADWVLVANILHQSDPAKILAEAKRIVSPTGHVAVIGWSTAATPFGPPVDKRKGIAEMKDIASSVGLTLAKEFTPSPYHFGLLFGI